MVRAVSFSSLVEEFGQAHRRRRLIFRRLQRGLYPNLMIVLPTLLAAIYYGLIAAPIFTSESRFVVRMAAPPSTNPVGSLLENAGITRSQDDTFSVRDFMLSRDALKALATKLPIHDMFGRSEADWLARFPTFWNADTFESLYRYYGARVDVTYNDNTGITTLEATGFRPDDAFDINRTLLDLGTAFLTQMNERARADAVGFSARELAQSEHRVVDAQRAITEFRNKELMIDPSQTSMTILDLIAHLSTQLADTRARRTELMATAAANSGVAVMDSQIQALQQQITTERAKVVGTSASASSRMSEYERLTLEREFADKELISASSALDSSRADANRQQLYLERVVEPNLSDEPDRPQRLKMVAVVGISLSAFYYIGWLLLAAIRDYRRR